MILSSYTTKALLSAPEQIRLFEATTSQQTCASNWISNKIRNELQKKNLPLSGDVLKSLQLEFSGLNLGT